MCEEKRWKRRWHRLKFLRFRRCKRKSPYHRFRYIDTSLNKSNAPKDSKPKTAQRNKLRYNHLHRLTPTTSHNVKINLQRSIGIKSSAVCTTAWQFPDNIHGCISLSMLCSQSYICCYCRGYYGCCFWHSHFAERVINTYRREALIRKFDRTS